METQTFIFFSSYIEPVPKFFKKKKKKRPWFPRKRMSRQRKYKPKWKIEEFEDTKGVIKKQITFIFFSSYIDSVPKKKDDDCLE
jgi:hypothetical protein